MDQPKITLAIYGNQNSNSGFQPLFWINNPAQQLENLVPPGMEENNYFFVLQNTARYSQFTLVQNHVSSYMSSRPGVLKMAIEIPQGYQLADDQSPFNVLLNIRELFLSTCMTQKSALSQRYNFKERMPAPDQFIALTDRYHLLPVQRVPYAMTGSEDAFLPLDMEQTSLLFKNPHYPEFVQFRQVVIAPKGNTASYSHTISGLTIPRPQQLPPQPSGEAAASSQPDNEAVTSDIPHQPRKLSLQIAIEGADRQTVMPHLVILAGLPEGHPYNISPQGTVELSDEDIDFLYSAEMSAASHHPDYIVTGTRVQGLTLIVTVAHLKPGAQMPSASYRKDSKGTFLRHLPWIASIGAVGAIVLVGVILFLPRSTETILSLPIHEDASEIYTDEEPYSDNRLEPVFSPEQLEECDDLLSDPGLTFNEVDIIYEWATDPLVDSLCQAASPDFATRIRAYHKVVGLLREGQLQEAIDYHDKNGHPLNIIHYWQMHAALDGWVDHRGMIHMYQPASREQARLEYTTHYHQMEAFIDLFHIHDTGSEKHDDTSPYSLTGKTVDGWPTATRQAEPDEEPATLHR